MSQMETPLSSRLADPARPVFLLGDVPPGEGTPPGKCQTICDKFMHRSRALASDGFIVYDIQDEPGRADGMERPFPFRKVMDSSYYAALLARSSGKQCVVYKCVADAQFDNWLQTASQEHGHSAVNLVGRASSQGKYEGPTIAEAMTKVNQTSKMKFGCVCIAERHTLEAAQARGKTYPTEHLNMFRKQQAGAEWFISQAIYDPEPTIRLLKDYAAVCREKGVTPKKVLLTFCPVSREKTIRFIKWLGVRVPQEIEDQILKKNQPDEAVAAAAVAAAATTDKKKKPAKPLSSVDISVNICCESLKTILLQCSGIGVPLGISCESVSIFKAEIDGVHDLFRQLQEILLDSRGTPWKVQWVEIMPPASTQSYHDDDHNNDNGNSNTSRGSLVQAQGASGSDMMYASLVGAALGGMIAMAGVVVGGQSRRK